MMDSDNNNQIDFSSVLAATVHDMKNSLCMLIQSIDRLSEQESRDKNPEKVKELTKVHYEASRLNTNLLQMLSLYRAEKNQLPMIIEEHYVEDIIEELVEKNQFYADSKAINIDADIESDLMWFVDANLIGNLLNDVFVNALRYTKDSIKITAYIKDDHLEIAILDNGNGYPEHMLQTSDLTMQEMDLDNNRTGLGLFFARLIANAHTNKDDTGYIKLANDCEIGGSVFTLVLP
jgi:K+-sensing histidine kinase KdpD